MHRVPVLTQNMRPTAASTLLCIVLDTLSQVKAAFGPPSQPPMLLPLVAPRASKATWGVPETVRMTTMQT